MDQKYLSYAEITFTRLLYSQRVDMNIFQEGSVHLLNLNYLNLSRANL